MNFEIAQRVQIVNSAGDITGSQSELGTEMDVPEHLKDLYCRVIDGRSDREKQVIAGLLSKYQYTFLKSE
jgi:hypothetical protein